MQAREGVATLIGQALGASVSASARSVVAFSTMEAVGLLHAMDMCASPACSWPSFKHPS
jgi:hypothetical protein